MSVYLWQLYETVVFYFLIIYVTLIIMAIYEEKYNANMTSLNELKTQQGKIISTIICNNN